MRFPAGRALLASVALAGCVPPSLGGGASSQGSANTVTVYDVRRGVVESGSTVLLSGLAATTPRTADDREFYVQAPAGGAESGIRVELEHPSHGLEIAVGDNVQLQATVMSRYGERYLLVEDMNRVAVSAGTPALPTDVGIVLSWDAWNGVLVRILEVDVLDCGDVRGVFPLDVGIGLDPAQQAVSLGAGDHVDGLVGLMTGRSDRFDLRLRPGDDRGVRTPGEGCATTVTALRDDPPSGRVALAGVVVTAVTPDGRGLFLQDAGGRTGVELVSADGPVDVDVGAVVDVEAIVEPWEGRRRLRLDQRALLSETGTTTPVARAVDPSADTFDPAGVDGALIRLSDLVLGDLVSPGRVATDGPFLIDDALYEGIPEDGSWTVTGVVRAQDPPLLLPRGPGDLVDAGGDTGAL